MAEKETNGGGATGYTENVGVIIDQLLADIHKQEETSILQRLTVTVNEYLALDEERQVTVTGMTLAPSNTVRAEVIEKGLMAMLTQTLRHAEVRLGDNVVIDATITSGQLNTECYLNISYDKEGLKIYWHCV